MKIVYVHGANATPTSFTFIKSKIDKHQAIDFKYNANDPLEDSICRLIDIIPQQCAIVSHSLGGILAVAASQHLPAQIISVITISAPFGGSEAATRMSWLFPFNTFVHNISTQNPTLREIVTAGIAVPTLNIITTEGQSMFEPKANDGVVTFDSQTTLKGGIQIQVPLNHFEVLLDERVAQIINNFINR